MAASIETINDSDSPSKGVYGIFNRFFIRITTDTVSPANLRYRVKVTPLQETALAYEVDVDPIDEVGIIDPIKELGEIYAKYDYNGQVEAVDPFGYSNYRIEVGEIEGTPPTFGGYDDSLDFYAFNGFTPKVRVDNYRIPELFDTTPILLPKVQKTMYNRTGDVDILSLFSFIPYDGLFDYQLHDLVGEYYNASGVLQTTSTIDLLLRPAFSSEPLGYYNLDVNALFGGSVHDGTYDYVEVYGVYEAIEGLGSFETERYTIRNEDCYDKYDRFRLCWSNRYGASEYLNFDMRSDEVIQVDRGKVIRTDGVDYEAATAADISNVNIPQKIDFGKSYDRIYTLRSNWLIQSQIDALEDLYRSPAVLMYDQDDNLFPVIVMDTSYEITDVKAERKTVAVRLMIAEDQPIQIQ